MKWTLYPHRDSQSSYKVIRVDDQTPKYEIPLAEWNVCRVILDLVRRKYSCALHVFALAHGASSFFPVYNPQQQQQRFSSEAHSGFRCWFQSVISTKETPELRLELVPHLSHLSVSLDLRVDKRAENVGRDGKVGEDELRLLVKAEQGEVVTQLHGLDGVLLLNNPRFQLLHGRLLLWLHGGAHHLPLHHAVLVQSPLVLVEHALLVALTEVSVRLQQVQEKVQFLHHVVLFPSALLSSLVRQHGELHRQTLQRLPQRPPGALRRGQGGKG